MHSSRTMPTRSVRLRVFCKQIWKQRYLMLFVIPAVTVMILFKFVPILGLQIAFKN